MHKPTLFISSMLLLAFPALASCQNNVIQSSDRNIEAVTIKEETMPELIVAGKFDEAGIVLHVVYSDGSTEDVPLSSSMLGAEYQNALSTPGTYQISFLFRGQVISFEIIVVPAAYGVTFFAYNENAEYVVKDSQVVEYGKKAVAPKVDSDIIYEHVHYTFKGWDKTFSVVTSNLNVYALYDEVACYSVSFYKGDGNLINSQWIDEGQDAIEPSPEERAVDGYDFIGWDRSYLNVEKDIDVYGLYTSLTKIGEYQDENQIPEGVTPIKYGVQIANKSQIESEWHACDQDRTIELTVFPEGDIASLIETGELSITTNNANVVEVEGTTIKPISSGDARISVSFHNAEDSVDLIVDPEGGYRCTFQNDDGSILSTQYCNEGESVYYWGLTPEKAPTDDGNGNITYYTFNGWDKDTNNITRNTVFIAVYREQLYHKCTFVNYDGSVLWETEIVDGGDVYYEGRTPTHPQEADGTLITNYVFSNWDKSTYGIKEATAFVAQYRTHEFIGHKVEFLNFDDSLLYEHYFEDGTDAYYDQSLPFVYDSEKVSLFTGWNGTFENVTESRTIKAECLWIPRSQNGEYPKDQVKDNDIISALEQIQEQDENGYYHYEGKKYEGLVSNNKTLFFEVEPIQWKFVADEDEGILVTSEYLIDAKRYNVNYTGPNENGFYANNYAQSELRAWLIGDFYNKAFGDENTIVVTSNVDNSSHTTGEVNDNPYCCESTQDKIYLFSVEDLNNATYSFGSDRGRACQVTDYAVANGGKRDGRTGNGYYWTRSPIGTKPNDFYSVDISSGFNTWGDVEDIDCIRPVMHISL